MPKIKLFLFHLAVISSPKQYLTLLSSIRTCLTHVEAIITSHSPISRQPTGDSKAPPPPVPPKPSRMQKPAVPPKPKQEKHDELLGNKKNGVYPMYY